MVVITAQHKAGTFYINVNLLDVMQDADSAAMDRIQFKFTHEGVITDVIDSDGEIVGTSAEEYYDIIYDLV